MRVVLDAEAVNALVTPREATGARTVALALEAARRLARPVVVPAVVLAELYRTPGRSAALDAALVRAGPALLLRDTDRRLARLVGAVLRAAGADSAMIVDAHAVACAVEDGGGVVLTGDPSDLEALAAAYGSVTVVPLTS